MKIKAEVLNRDTVIQGQRMNMSDLILSFKESCLATKYSGMIVLGGKGKGTFGLRIMT